MNALPPVPTVFIVDDEASIRASLTWLLNSIQLPVICFDSAASFLAGYRPDARGCLVLDVRMPGISGIELLELLDKHHIFLPVIFLSAHGDIPMATHAMRRGAIDFLSKPYNNEQFLSRVGQALALDAELAAVRHRKASLARRFATLTRREQQLLDLIVTGAGNKDIARELAISIKTVEAHRARLVRKLEVASLAELVHLAIEYGQPAH